MKIIQQTLKYKTQGSPQWINVTADLVKALQDSKLEKGSLTVFVVGSTAGMTTFEYEPGLMQDMTDLYEKMIPSGRSYHHDQTWGDANGYSHLRSALTGPSLCIPFDRGKLLLGTWQQVVLAEFDNRPRSREVVISMTGE